MALYTILVEYAGGTYVGQGEGDDLSAAFEDWSERFRSGKVLERRTAAFVKAVRRAVSGNNIVPLRDNVNVWCFSAIFARQLMLGYVVLTDGVQDLS